MECDVMGGSGGINVYEKAWEQMTREKSFEGYVPERVCIALDQNGGAPCRPTVLPGEYVFRGQVIGEPACEATPASADMSKKFTGTRGRRESQRPV